METKENIGDFLISVIVTTYNRPDALKVVLDALSNQSDLSFEIVVADDGSKDDTKAMIETVKSSSKVAITHAWQPDEGFRVAAARNLAAKAAKGDYFLFLDGDCVPPVDWIRNQRRLAEKGWMVPGQRVLLSESFTQELLNQDQTSHDWSFRTVYQLYQQKKVNRPWPALCIGLGFLRKLNSQKWEKARTCNWGIWKDDFFAVNGFDESFEGWGHEDADLAVRLVNKGVRVKSGVFSTVVYHLWHKQESRSSVSKNWAIVKDRERTKAIFPEIGLFNEE